MWVLAAAPFLVGGGMVVAVVLMVMSSGRRERQSRDSWLAAGNALLPVLDVGRVSVVGSAGARIVGNYRNHEVTIHLDPEDPEGDSPEGIRIQFMLLPWAEDARERRHAYAQMLAGEFSVRNSPRQQRRWLADPTLRAIMGNLGRGLTAYPKPPQLVHVRPYLISLWAEGTTQPPQHDVAQMLAALHAMSAVVWRPDPPA